MILWLLAAGCSPETAPPEASPSTATTAAAEAPARSTGPLADPPLPESLRTSSRVVPEYLRTLDEVFFLDSGRHDLDLVLGDVMRAMPAYTRFRVISERPDLDEVSSLRGREVVQVRDHLPKLQRDATQFWAQDYFKALPRADGTRTLLTTRGEFFSPEAARQLAELGYDLRASSLRWEGGNLAIDDKDGQSLLFVGFTIHDPSWPRSENPDVPADQVLATLAQELGVDRAIAVPYVTGNLFHLDQFFMLVGGGRVVVLDVETGGSAEALQVYVRENGNYLWRTFHEQALADAAAQGLAAPSEDALRAAYGERLEEQVERARQQVEKMDLRLDEVAGLFQAEGYTVHRLAADPRLLLDHASPLNGLPYFDRQNGRARVLLPLYQEHPRAGTPVESELQARAEALFGSLGYDVGWVASRTAAAGGGPHCISNIAR